MSPKLSRLEFMDKVIKSTTGKSGWALWSAKMQMLGILAADPVLAAEMENTVTFSIKALREDVKFQASWMRGMAKADRVLADCLTLAAS
jgi:hypothetical protein